MIAAPTLTEAAPRYLPAASAAPAPAGSLLAGVLDQLDHGILVLASDGRVLHANRAAVRACMVHEDLCLRGDYLTARNASAAAELARALAAAHRGLRTLLPYAHHAESVSLVVVPLAHEPGACGTVLAMFGRRGAGDTLKVELFARACGLTLAECGVLQGLNRGLDPTELARRHGVQLCTVRTQIGSIREKTRTGSIRALIALLHSLPPAVSAVS